MLESVENAMHDTPFPRATCALKGTDAANSGPRMISAPSSSACWAPCCAPWGVPPSSLIRSWMFGFWNSASAISPAFFMDCAATPALPDPDRGRISPTLTWPLPATAGCWGGPAGALPSELPNELENWPAEQADSKGTPSRRPIAVRRVAVEGCRVDLSDPDLSGPTFMSLGLTDDSARAPFLKDDQRVIQAHCRRIVNQNKRIMARDAHVEVAMDSFFTVKRRRN